MSSWAWQPLLGANQSTTHDLTAALVGQGAAVSAVLAHQHVLSASLLGQGSALSATLDHTAPGASHDLTASLLGQGATLSAALTHYTLHNITASLVGQGASLAATLSHFAIHGLTGELTGQGAELSASFTLTPLNPVIGVPAPVGHGKVYYQGQRPGKKRKKLDDILNQAVEEFLTPEIKEEIKESKTPAIREIVEPFLIEGELDWPILIGDIKALRALIFAYEFQQDEEEIFILLLSL